MNREFLRTSKTCARVMAMLVVLFAVSNHRAEGDELQVVGDLRMVSTSTTAGGKLQVPGDGLMGIRWFDDFGEGALLADMHRFGAVDDRLYVTNSGTSNLTGVYLASGATTWTSTSDERLKFDVEPLAGILDKIRDIRVIEYNMAARGVDPSSGQVFVDYNRPARMSGVGTPIKHEIGSVAQDWLKHFPQLVDEPKNDGGYYGLAYERIGIIAIGAIKELEARVAELERQLAEARGAALAGTPEE